MYKHFFLPILTIVMILICFLTGSLASYGQSKKQLDSVDKVIIAQYITPAEQQAGAEDPQWGALVQKIKESHTGIEADRAVHKAQIYYYYGKNWPKFCSALVIYTDSYEDKNDFKLMDKNANMVLLRSNEVADFQKAAAWMMPATNTGNDAYKKTYEALIAKISALKRAQ